jgi:DNA (cytosine-5)-methyltransferase 1
MPKTETASDQCRVLGKKIGQKRREGPSSQKASPRGWLACAYRLGVSGKGYDSRAAPASYQTSNKKMTKPRVASFFAGIGGFDLGFERAGFDVVFQCEIHRFCSSVLRQHWPDAKYIPDISKVMPGDVPDSEVWCGGFPCQDLSVARGSRGRTGLNGSRSGLFFHLAELTRKNKPKVLLIENVQGLLNANDGKDFAQLLLEIGALGYAISWRLLNTRYFGLPQSRPRVYICAWLDDPVRAGEALFETKFPSPVKNERRAFLETSCSLPGPLVPKVSFCLSATSGRHTGTDWSRTYVAYENDVRRMTPVECERLQGFPDNWTKLEDELASADLADSLRYHALGNAVSVAVIQWIAKRIHSGLEGYAEERTKPPSPKDLFEKHVQRWPGLATSSPVRGRLKDVIGSDAKYVWPNAGLLWNGQFMVNRTPPALHRPIESDLSDIIEKARPDATYFLSKNAAEGILRRVDSQERHLFPPLRQALERLAGRNLQVLYPPGEKQASLPLREPRFATY